MIIIKATDGAKMMIQIILFHKNTFNPSIMLKGMRLRTAIKALIHATKTAMVQKNDIRRVIMIIVHIAEIIMLVKGPERAVFPTVSLVAGPAIITAPGEMILKRGRSIERRVMSAPCMVSRNSAHNPKCCAENLWASS